MTNYDTAFYENVVTLVEMMIVVQSPKLPVDAETLERLEYHLSYYGKKNNKSEHNKI